MYQKGTANAPDYIEPWFIHADVAVRKNDFDEAVKAWAFVREKFPKAEIGYTSAARACIEKRDFFQAEIFCKEGMKNVPGRSSRTLPMRK